MGADYNSNRPLTLLQGENTWSVLAFWEATSCYLMLNKEFEIVIKYSYLHSGGKLRVFIPLSHLQLGDGQLILT